MQKFNLPNCGNKESNLNEKRKNEIASEKENLSKKTKYDNVTIKTKSNNEQSDSSFKEILSPNKQSNDSIKVF